MELPSINLATDSLGLGSLFGGFTSSTKGTEDCGAKPTCISLSKNSQCAQKNKAYQDCILKSQEVKLKMSQTQQPQNSISPIMLMVIGLIVLIIVVLLFKKN